MAINFSRRRTRATWKIIGALSLSFCSLWFSTGLAQAAAVQNGTTFTDYLSSQDTSRFIASGPWANGLPFANGWQPDHASFANDLMQLKFDNTPFNNLPYTSGEYRSKAFYGYGCYEVRMKPSKLSGVISSFFTYAGSRDIAPGANGLHNEIDIEFLGKDTTKMQIGFFNNDVPTIRGTTISLGFDASQQFHNYAFKWTAPGIGWYVDGKLVKSLLNLPTDPTPNSADATQKIMMNLWAVDNTDSGAVAWAGAFTYPGSPFTAQYDWIKYTQGDKCNPTAKVKP